MKIPKNILESLEGVKRKALPRQIEPMKATLVDAPFSREGWLFENKFDGIRTICYIKNSKITLYSRNQKEMTFRYPEVAGLPKAIDADTAILDGEIVVVDKNGDDDFQELQSRFSVVSKDEIKELGKTQKIIFYVFDLLYLDGYNIMGAELLERKKLLKKILHQRSFLKYSSHVLTKGEALFKKAEKAHLEGIIAKNAHSTYVERRSNEWLKIKTVMRQEVVVVGYTPPQGSRKYFGSLELGIYDKNKLYSVGRVGSGFDADKLKQMYDLMQKYKIDEHPFAAEPEQKRGVQWLKPKLVGEVRFTEWTAEGKLRHPVFEGLRYDKRPIQCQYERKHFVTEEVIKAEHAEETTKKRSSRTKKTNGKDKTKVKAKAKAKTRAKAKSPKKKPSRKRK